MEAASKSFVDYLIEIKFKCSGVYLFTMPYRRNLFFVSVMINWQSRLTNHETITLEWNIKLDLNLVDTFSVDNYAWMMAAIKR